MNGKGIWRAPWQRGSAAAVIVTGGCVERLAPALVASALQRTRVHVIVTRDGDPAELRRAGLPYTRLERCPA
jgi:hypothetical protein